MRKRLPAVGANCASQDSQDAASHASLPAVWLTRTSFSHTDLRNIFKLGFLFIIQRSDRMLELILASLVFGSIYALFGFAFAFTYRLENYLDFSHLAVFLIGTYLTWIFYSYLGFGRLTVLLIIIPVSIIFGIIFYLPNYLLKNCYNKLLFSIAVLALVRGVLSLAFKGKSLPKPAEGLLVGATVISSASLLPVLLLLLFPVLTYVVMKKTIFGKAARAVLAHEPTARILGINIHFVKLTSIAVSSALAGFSGLLLSTNLNESTLTLLPGFKAMAIAILGNFGAVLTTAMAFATILIENLVKLYFPLSDYYSGFIIFGILLLILLFRIPKRGRK